MSRDAAKRESFQSHLGANPETAEAAYLALKERLVFYFAQRRCSDPENLASEVVSRAIAKCDEGAVIQNGILNYCYGIASNVLREEWRAPRTAELQPNIADGQGLNRPDSVWHRKILLEQMMKRLRPDERRLITDYFLPEGRETEEKSAMSRNALRIRVYRILEKLRSHCRAESSGRESSQGRKKLK